MDLIGINEFSDITERNIVNRIGVPHIVNIGHLLSLHSLWLYDDVSVISFFKEVPYSWVASMSLIVTPIGNFHYRGSLTNVNKVSLFLKVCNYSCTGKRYDHLLDITSQEYFTVLCQVLRNVIVESANLYHNKILGSVEMPAFGYFILPNHSEKVPVVSYFDPTSKYIRLTSSYMMDPESSICGLCLSRL